jgi:ribosomal protein S18 acetylase RimI-like enzyme
MPTFQPEFTISIADHQNTSDTEISELLTRVYVAGGFTTIEEAVSLFEPSAVRRRGIMLSAREKRGGDFAGMVIIVPPDSPARRLTDIPGAELHLLGVHSGYRRHGLGRLLVDTAIEQARCKDYTSINLWTQFSMTTAQRLYESVGFVHVHDHQRNGRQFKVYARQLAG